MSFAVDPGIFAAQGRSLSLGGDRPLPLTDPATAYVVADGYVDVFALFLVDGRPDGRRHHLFRAETGQALFGFRPGSDRGAVGLLAVGGPETRLIELQRSRLTETADQTARQAGAGLIEDWLTQLQTALRPGLPPSRFTAVAPDGETTVAADQPVRTEAGLVWVKPLDGVFRFGGLAGTPALDPGEYFPLAAPAWLAAEGEGRLAGVGTAAVAAQGALDQAIDSGQVLLQDLLGLNLAQAAERDRDHLAARTESNRTALSSALHKIAAVLGRRKADPFLEALSGDDLLDACRLVGRAQGITINPPAEKLATGDRLAEIANASRIRFRRVTLTGRWWREDNGPLLGLLKAEQRPVALIPGSDRTYFLVDPTAKTRVAIGAREAELFSPEAVVFYRPFPDRSLTWRDLLRFGLSGLRRDFGRIIGLGTLVGLLGLVTPIATGIVFNEIIPRATVSYLWQMAFILLACYLASALLSFVRNIAILRLEGRLDGLTQAAVWDRLLSLPTPFFRLFSSGDLTMRAMGIEAMRRIVSGATITNILASIFSLFNLALLFYYDASLALVALGLVLVAVIFTGATSYLQLKYQRRLVNIQGRISSLLQQIVQGLAKIRISGAQDRAFAVWADRFSDQNNQAYRAGRVTNALLAFNSAFPFLALAVIFAWLIFKGQGRLSTGNFLAFNAAFSSFLAGAMQMSASLISLLYVVPYYERLKPIIQARPEVDETKTDPGRLSGRVELNKVTFRYDPKGPTILKDISLTIAAGAFVALVGPSGSGKSTLLRLLLGFEEPESGTIYYDNCDLASVDVRRVRRQIGVVLQTAQVMPGDIQSNILGTRPLGQAEAWEAAEAAGLAEDIKAMPMGLHTLVNEGGSTLSGGQRQRLLIARALVCKPRIIFFDEATSALDNQTQATVQHSLDRIEATRLVIAHRLSTVVRADRILVLDQGRIVETGTYEELMAGDGLFREMAQRQLF